MYERTELLCYMLGWCESQKGVKRNDALIIIDQVLFKMNQPSITVAEKESIRRIGDEMDIFLIQMGIGRSRARQIAKDGHL